MNYEPIDYLVRVPDHYRIPGLDAQRWLLVSPGNEHNPTEGHPITEREASDLFSSSEAEIGRPWVADVRRDLTDLEMRHRRVECPAA
jgi:hypothetical protein